MSYIFNGYCPIYQKEIAEGKCIEILHELGGFKKKEEVKYILRYFRKGATVDDLNTICQSCPNCPPE